MKAQLHLATISLFTLAVFAQNPVSPDKPPSGQDSKATTAPAAAQNNAPPEMKTRGYSGTLSDASCGSGRPAATTASTSTKPDSAAASGAAETAKAGSGGADRA